MIRISCLVPFCRCTVFAEGRHVGATEVICPKHWRHVPRGLRARYAEARRRATPDGRIDWFRVRERLWDRCKAAAIEAAGGI